MKRKIIFIILFLLFFCPKIDAAMGSLGLIVEGGKSELVLQKGEKNWLFVQNGFSGLPQFKGLTFFSDNTFVATVGLHTGIVTANNYGEATISVTDEAGENAIIKIKVITSDKKPSLFIFIVIIILFGAIWLYFHKI